MNRSGARVLVVDDQWTIRKQLSRALEAVGVRCDCAVNGDDALVQYLYEGHELIVTDLRMPQENGHSLAVALLGLPDPPKVVALTAVTEPRLAEDLMTRGVTEVAYKPIDYFAFADRLKELLGDCPPGREPSPRQTKSIEGVPAIDSLQPSGGLPPRTRADLELQFAESSPPHPWLTLTLRGLDWEQLPNPPMEMRNVLRKLSAPPTEIQHEARRESRVALNETVVALALSDSLEPIGQPFKAILKDVSEHGIGIIHSQKLGKHPLAVSWQGVRKTRIVVLARVLRCREVGAFFDIGGAIARFKLAGDSSKAKDNGAKPRLGRPAESAI